MYSILPKAIAEIADNLRKAMHRHSCGVFLNSKAFDTVNHAIHVQKT